MTHRKILDMLAGHDAQHPLAFDDLIKASGLLPGTLNMILLQMYDCTPRPINYATITKKGKTQTVYWPTGVVNSRPGSKSIAIGNHELYPRQPGAARLAPVAKDTGSAHPASTPCTYPPAAREVQRNTAISTKKVQQTAGHETKDNDMTKPTGVGRGGSQPSTLNQTIFDLIEAKPGILQPELVKKTLRALPSETQTHILKTAANMQHVTKKIRSEGRGEAKAYCVAGASSPVEKQEAAAPAAIAEKEIKFPDEFVDSQVSAAEAKPLAEAILKAAIAHTEHLAAAQTDDHFMLMLIADGSLVITLGGDHMHLSPEQTTRLQQFMARMGAGQKKPSLLQRLFGSVAA
jgi:hypothetical protein